MDIILYFKIRSRGPLDPNQMINNQTIIDIFISLPVKKIMVGQFTQYVRSPLAEYVESNLYFTYYFPFISANFISFFHCLISILTIKFFSNESLFQRRIGVLLFEFRNFLDCLDGVVYRAHIKNSHYKSHRDLIGYYIDGIADVLGGICLIIGCLLYFFKHRPLNSNTHKISQTTSRHSSRASDNESEENDLIILNIDDEQQIISTSSSVNSNLFQTKGKILIVLCLFALRYALAGLFWDREVESYENLLDSYTNKAETQTLQLTILHSPLTIFIFYLWRYLSALSIQDYLLLAIFFDRTWDFIVKTNIIGWISFSLTVLLTELHINQVKSLFAIL